MLQLNVRVAVLLALVATLAAPANAAFTGLGWIPTGDIKSPQLLYTGFSSYPGPGIETDVYYNAQFGVNKYLEVGYDHSLTNGGGYFNWKARFDLGEKNGAIAVGDWSIKDGSKNRNYIAYSTHAGMVPDVRFHFGIIDVVDSDREKSPFLGMTHTFRDLPLIGNYYSTFEWIGGDVDCFGVGGSFEIMKDTYFMLNGFYDNDSKPYYYVNLGRFIQF